MLSMTIIQADMLAPLMESASTAGEIPGSDFEGQLPIDKGIHIGGAHQLPIFDEGHPVAGDFHFAEKMRVEENGCTFLAQIFNDIAHHPPANRVQPGGWFIEEDQIWPIEQGLRQSDALQHPFREGAQFFIGVGCQVNQIEHFRDTVS